MQTKGVSMLIKKTTVYFKNPTMEQDRDITCVEHLVADSMPSDMTNDYMSEKYEEIKNGMIVYRLENRKSGDGPFTSGVDVPIRWLDSHYPPMDTISPVHEEFEEWMEVVNKGHKYLPYCYKFAFSSLMKLKRCFKGYEDFSELRLMEYVIDISELEYCCLLSDGQVIFSEVISKIEL